MKHRLKALRAKMARGRRWSRNDERMATRREGQGRQGISATRRIRFSEWTRIIASAQDTFYVGTLQGRRTRLWSSQTYVSTSAASSRLRQKLYDRKTPLTAADLLNDRVIPFWGERHSPCSGVLLERGTEYCGTHDRHTNTSSNLAVEGVESYPNQGQAPRFSNEDFASFDRTARES